MVSFACTRLRGASRRSTSMAIGVSAAAATVALSATSKTSRRGVEAARLLDIRHLRMDWRAQLTVASGEQALKSVAAPPHLRYARRLTRRCPRCVDAG